MKMRLRLMKLSDCPNGTRYFNSVRFLPRTLVTNNKKTGEAVYHIGHEFNINAVKRHVDASRKVWAVVNFKDLP